MSVSACWAAAELAAQVTLVVFAAIGLATVEGWLVESARLYLRRARGGTYGSAEVIGNVHHGCFGYPACQCATPHQGDCE